MNRGWYDPRPLGPPPGIELVDRLCMAEDAEKAKSRRERAMKFVADNPDHPLVREYKAKLAELEKEHGGKEK